MDKKMKQAMIVVAFGVILLVALSNLNEVGKFFSYAWGILLPVTVGGVLAFLLNVPMRAIENGLTHLFLGKRRGPSAKAIRGASLLLTLACILLVLLLVSRLVVPELVSSVKSVYDMAVRKIPDWVAALQAYDIDAAWLNEFIASLDVNKIIAGITGSAGDLMNTIVSAAASTVGVLVTFVMAVIIGVYALSNKDDLARQGRKLAYAYLKKSVADRLCYLAGLVNGTFGKFISGQCVEAIILGCMMFLAFFIFRLPYAGLIGVLTAVCSFIPYVGAFLSCATGALLTLLISPLEALISVIVFQVVQFIEGQFIYPRVVGGSIGLSPMLTLVAALLGGKLMGIAGMIFFIPLTAVFYTVLRDSANGRLEKRGISIS